MKILAIRSVLAVSLLVVALTRFVNLSKTLVGLQLASIMSEVTKTTIQALS